VRQDRKTSHGCFRPMRSKTWLWWWTMTSGSGVALPHT
jgi:hypothetical protein